MKNIFFIAVLTVMPILANAAENKPFIWADDEAYWPVIYRGENGKPAGVFNDIMTELFAHLDIPLKKSVYPWKRVQRMVKNGDADGMVTVYTKERKEFTVATDPIWEIGESLFFRRDNPKACKILKIKSFDDLRDLTLVDNMGSGWTKEKYDAHAIKNVMWVPTIESAFNVLAKGRADVFIMFDLKSYKILAQQRTLDGPLQKGFQNIIAITPSFATLPFRLLIRMDSPFAKRVPEINKVLKEMKEDGFFQHIRQKYAGIMPLL